MQHDFNFISTLDNKGKIELTQLIGSELIKVSFEGQKKGAIQGFNENTYHGENCNLFFKKENNIYKWNITFNKVPSHILGEIYYLQSEIKKYSIDKKKIELNISNKSHLAVQIPKYHLVSIDFFGVNKKGKREGKDWGTFDEKSYHIDIEMYIVLKFEDEILCKLEPIGQGQINGTVSTFYLENSDEVYQQINDISNLAGEKIVNKHFSIISLMS